MSIVVGAVVVRVAGVHGVGTAHTFVDGGRAGGFSLRGNAVAVLVAIIGGGIVAVDGLEGLDTAIPMMTHNIGLMARGGIIVVRVIASRRARGILAPVVVGHGHKVTNWRSGGWLDVSVEGFKMQRWLT